MEFVEISKDKWNLPYKSKEAKLLKVFKNDAFLVQIYEEKSGYIRLSVNRTWCRFDESGKPIWLDMIIWDELNEIKNDLGYKENWMVECYPPESDFVNVANIRHLFLLKEPPAFGWHKKDRGV